MLALAITCAAAETLCRWLPGWRIRHRTTSLPGPAEPVHSVASGTSQLEGCVVGLGWRLAVVGSAALVVVAYPVFSSSSRSDSPNDATAMLQARIDALKPGDTLTLDPGIYRHSGVIKVNVPGVRVDGGGATLQATNDSTSAVQIVANDVELTNIRLTAPTDGQRRDQLDQHKLVISGQHDTVSHVTIVGSAAAGIFVTGAQNFTLRDISVSGTRADGVHITGGSANGVVDDLRSDATGDDALAVVSYASDPGPSHDISASRISVASTRWGRGISVVGGDNVTVRGFSVANTSAAGVSVVTEGSPWFSRAVDHVEISDGTITGANTDPTVVHGAILLSAANVGTSVSNVSISNVGISATTPTAEREVAILAEGGTLNNVAVTGIRLDNSALSPLATNAPPSSFRVTGWTAKGEPIAVS